ncbi:MAG: amino acid permease [Chitinophagaceae bacterium]
MGILSKKPLEQVIQESKNNKNLKRQLTSINLIAIGIGAIVGAGIFVRTADAAGGHAGNAITLSFLIASLACAFSALCYAELSSMIPISGSAYTYAYTTMGELVAWVIGWALILEYALGAATVSIAWSEYINDLLQILHFPKVPYAFSHSPFEISADGVHGLINLPALFIVFILTLVLIKGIGTTAIINNILVLVKISIVVLFIILGWQFINPNYHMPYFIEPNTPAIINNQGNIVHEYQSFFNHGWGGMLRGASIVFFAFIGFDVVSTSAQETKNPKKAMPIGIIGSLLVCTFLYILFGHVFTGIAPYQDFLLAGKEASVSYAIRAGMPSSYEWLASATTVAIVFGFTSVIMVMMMGQSRIFFCMAKDGLLPKFMGKIHCRFQTPYKSNWVVSIFVGLFAAFVPGSIVGGLTTVGTLLAFIIASSGVIILRKTKPKMPRPFKVPFSPIIPILGISTCALLIIFESFVTQLSALAWLFIGLIIYFAYSKRRSNLRN